MTRVDFYVLNQEDPGGRFLFACRLAEKAYQQGHSVYIHADTAADARQLDTLLWTFRAGSFVPHQPMEEGMQPEPDTPVHIGHGSEPGGHDDVLINLAAEVPLFFSRFKRVAEVLDGEEERRREGRERYRFYRDRGYTLKSHQI